jgi:Flp pilus assembly protein TadD
LKQLLTAFCLILLARWSVADQRKGSAALEKAIDAFNQGQIEQAEKLVEAAARADSKKPEIPNLRGAIIMR